MSKRTLLKSFAKQKKISKAEDNSFNKNNVPKASEKNIAQENKLVEKSHRRFSGDYGTRGVRGTIRLEQIITISQKTVHRQEAPFAESCLPKTMKIAIDSRDLLFPLLKSYPSSWSFIDKIFALVAPVFEKDIENFYKNKGNCMAEMFSNLQVERFDKIVSQNLSEKIEAIKLEKGIK